ncbi:MAG: hypothetical protein AB7I30_10350, partial [Isosphaeraceae bacterium]
MTDRGDARTFPLDPGPARFLPAKPPDHQARGTDPVGADRAHILVLNYNGRDLLRECLPSVVEAAARAPFPCAIS